MYRHIKDYELRYTDVDVYDNLKLSSLLSFLEESACLSATELGFGYDELSPLHFGFILVNVYIKLNKTIKLGDILTIHTWPLKPSHAIFIRDSELYVAGEKVGVATARWCMVNTDTFAILPSSAYFKDGDFNNYNTQRSIQFSDWKIPKITDGEFSYSRRMAYSDYDHYYHVNNTKYADFLLDVFSVNGLKNRNISSVKITYVKQCKEGEALDFFRKKTQNGYIIEGRVDKETRIQAEINFD